MCCSGSDAGAVALFVVALCGLTLKGFGSTGDTNTNILIPYLKGKIKLNGLKENYVSFMYNNNIFGVVFILKC